MSDENLASLPHVSTDFDASEIDRASLGPELHSLDLPCPLLAGLRTESSSRWEAEEAARKERLLENSNRASRSRSTLSRFSKLTNSDLAVAPTEALSFPASTSVVRRGAGGEEGEGEGEGVAVQLGFVECGGVGGGEGDEEFEG